MPTLTLQTSSLSPPLQNAAQELLDSIPEVFGEKDTTVTASALPQALTLNGQTYNALVLQTPVDAKGYTNQVVALVDENGKLLRDLDGNVQVSISIVPMSHEELLGLAQGVLPAPISTPISELPKEERRYGLNKKVLDAADATLPAFANWIKEVDGIVTRAESGRAISGTDFLIADINFIQAAEDNGLREEIRKVRHDAFERKSKIEKEFPVGSPERAELREDLRADKVVPAYMLINMQDQKMLPAHLLDSDTKRETGVLDRAFARQFVTEEKQASASYIPDNGIQTEDALIHDMLSKNRGFALADIHTQSESLEFMTRHMQQLKKEGVDTIYTELPTLNAQVVQGSDVTWRTLMQPSVSVEDFEAIVRDIKGQLNSNEMREVNKVAYGPTFANDLDISTVDATYFAQLDFLLAAKKAGVDIKYVDRPNNLPRDIEPRLFPGMRQATSNFIWTDAINMYEGIKNREAEAAGNDPSTRRFIVWGGAAHFTNTPEQLDNPDRPIPRAHGFVDEALGIPSIGFASTNDPNAPAIVATHNSNDVDVQLPRQSFTVLPLPVVEASIDAIGELRRPATPATTPTPATSQHQAPQR
ncbi:MAG: hypothetical protein SFT92_02085 [Rickettsiales bacterium]|nr:hypothetical protein [Rickettsiales bacterium]